MSDYDDDILVWSERQGALLRRRAAGDLVNEAEVDWPNIAEEIEDVGRSQLNAVESLLRQALTPLLKAEAWPDCRDAPSWRADAISFRIDAVSRYAPSMRQRIDLAHIFRLARRALPATIEGQPPGPVAETCPMTLEALLAVGTARCERSGYGSANTPVPASRTLLHHPACGIACGMIVVTMEASSAS